MASVDLVRISVACEFGTWQTRYGEVVRDYESEGAAIVAAISQAQDLGRQGRFAAVIMRTLTSVYGPTGLIRTLPTRGRAAPTREETPIVEEAPALADPAPPAVTPVFVEVPAAEEERQEIEHRPLEPAAEDAPAMPSPAEEIPERPGRFMRIVAALAREAEEKGASGRSFHQTISRLARGRRVTSVR